ncbi:D-alanyl-D-alanine carboxypeptidase [Mycetocola tolaasinivorans]|uniref:D-alanyl-D-alanine carboxypeptidase n=1 Tax=Mycetocola tolaasinivorans TaxID=76635 RepID=A0A3L7A2R4_9MICO|nr:D-alanyl-D-alanine carboxypeptidase [Mycetocola tolaasinivorans]RLP74310.1 D-alanyl-D-alanine carboxypeptidase [Mycetocola tolaasinivorans]
MTDFPLRRDRRARARRRSLLRAPLAITIVIAVLAVCYGGYALLRPLPASAATPSPALATPALASAPLEWPADGVAAIGEVGHSGVLASRGSQERTSIASMTKTVTALVVLDKKPLAKGESGPTYTFTAEDQQIYENTVAEGGSRAPVVVGAQVTERQLLEGLMLPSGNNYAVTLANWAYGSMDEFLKAARIWLDKHGLTDTVLADASGINPGSQASPPNLVEIAKLVLAHPVLSTVVAEPTATIASLGDRGVLKNTNALLGTGGVIGLKTGTTIVAGACLMFAAEREIAGTKITVVGVVIGAPSHEALFASVSKLLDSAYAGFTDTAVIKKGDPVGFIQTASGSHANVVAAKDYSAVIWKDSAVTRDLKIDPLESGRQGDAAGTLTVTENGTTTEIPLVLADDLAGTSAWWRLVNPV